MILKQTYKMLRYYSNDDGGFMKHHAVSTIAPDDIFWCEYDTQVSDMNGTHLAITTRSAIYDLLEKPVPTIPANP